LLIVPAGAEVAVVGAVGSAGFPDAGEGGGAGTVCVVAGTVCCDLAPLVHIAQRPSIASRIAILEELFISNLA
jgi:hypothetical protein